MIPKVKHPTSIVQYRPISLCNTLYKIITKILVHRIKPLLHNIISPEQSDFLTKRRAFDNAIIVKEIINRVKCKKRKYADFLLKLDLEKAFDKTE